MASVNPGPSAAIAAETPKAVSLENAEAVPGGGGAASVVENIKNRRKNMELYQSHSHRMKTLMMTGAAYHSGMKSERQRSLNPLWTNFPTRCVREIHSPEEMREKLAYHTNSENVMVVRYHQKNCTACNALDKTFEFLCHQSKDRLPNLHFYDVLKEEQPELTRGLVRYPQVKGFSGGQWVDLDYKPPTAFREELYNQVEGEVQRRKLQGRPVTALQAEEMYFSAAGPAMLKIMEESMTQFYCKSQVRMHNYWKQISVRRSWFFKKFIEPEIEETVREEWRLKSVFGEKLVYGPEPSPDEF